MDLSRYLLFAGCLTRDEYQDLTLNQTFWGIPNLQDFPPDDLGRRRLDQVDDIAQVRELPFLDVLRVSDIGKKVCARSGKTLEALVQECNKWHLGRLEPICSYSTGCKYGKELYVRQAEKKYVAQYLVAAPSSASGAKIIQGGDKVIITEGTSGLYAGLAIASASLNADIITSDGGLIKEYRDNSAVAQGFHSLCIVGGEADYDNELARSEHYGVHGPLCKKLEEALTMRPPATVVLMTVSYLSADDGPFTIGQSATLKADIIRNALNSGVRKIVFLADYTKHKRSQDRQHHTQILRSSEEWRTMLSEHQGQIHIVTSPPPALRALLSSGRENDVRRRNNLSNISSPPVPFTDEDHVYNIAAFKLQKLIGGKTIGNEFWSCFSEAYEDILPTFPTVLTFTIDRATGFNKESYLAELQRSLGDGANLAEYNVDVRPENGQIRVTVVGWGTQGRPLRRLILQQQSQTVRQFAMRTSTRKIAGSLAGSPVSLNF